jgi:hypothetical protein
VDEPRDRTARLRVRTAGSRPLAHIGADSSEHDRGPQTRGVPGRQAVPHSTHGRGSDGSRGAAVTALDAASRKWVDRLVAGAPALSDQQRDLVAAVFSGVITKKKPPPGPNPAAANAVPTTATSARQSSHKATTDVMGAQGGNGAHELEDD